MHDFKQDRDDPGVVFFQDHPVHLKLSTLILKKN